MIKTAYLLTLHLSMYIIHHENLQNAQNKTKIAHVFVCYRKETLTLRKETLTVIVKNPPL